LSKEEAMSLTQSLIDLEHAGWKALSEGTGADFYRKYLTDDAVMVFPGVVLTREESIEAMEAAPPWKRFRIEEPRIVELTGGSALLTYRAIAQREGDEPYSALTTSVYVNQAGTWKMAFHQQTPSGDR
jgi:hypothetical protein